MTVTYKDIPEYPGYRVGDDGSVWSCWLPNGQGKGWQLTDRWRLLNLDARKFGRLYATLSRRGRSKSFQVHRLVLCVFVGPCPAGLEACHEDGNHLNNRLSNLYWGTHETNMRDRDKHGTTSRGEKHGRAKVTAQIVTALRSEIIGIRVRGDIKRLAAKYGLGRSQVGRILRGEHWRDKR